jgi:hypothetical protein
MSDRSVWLDQWCPECWAAPGARCQRWRYGRASRGRSASVPYLHVARGWFERSCPTCKASPGERCSTPTGREAAHVHAARLRTARWELVSLAAVWEELQRRGATVAIVPFFGRAGRGGHTDTISLLRPEGDELVEVERWSGRDELCHALEAPVWERFGIFAGHPPVRGDVIWSVADRRVTLVGQRGEQPFEEIVS